MKSIVEGFFMAWGNFSIIPCPHKVWTNKGKKWMLCLMPLIGVIIGFLNLCLVIAWNYFSYFKSVLVISCFSFLIPQILTGFIHLDGFMDCSDAILSRRDIETKQKILKDSRVGAFSVISLISLYLVGISASYTIFLNGDPVRDIFIMVFVHFLARSLASRDVQRLKPIATSQYAYKSEEIQEKNTIIFSLILMMILATVGFGIAYCLKFWIQYITAMTSVFILQKIVRYKAVKDLGGMNGDIAGYSIVLGELAGLVSLAVIQI